MLTSEEVSKIERDFADGDTGWMGDRASLRALLKDRAELQAELHRFRSLVEAHEEVKAQLKAEIERLRCALGTIAYDTSLSVPLGQKPGAHYRMMTHSCIITAVNALEEEVGE